EGSPATVSFSGASDPSNTDTAAGFHYSFATSASALAGDYASAGAADAAQFTFDDNGTYTVYGRIIDKDGGYTDYQTVVVVNEVAPTVNLIGSASVAEASIYTLTLGPVVDPGQPIDQVVTYFIHWGDNSDTVINATDLSPNRQVTHVYADGIVPQGSTTPTNHISVDLLDNDGYWCDTGAKDIVVYNVNPTAALGGSTTVNEGSSVTVLFYNQYDPSAVDTEAGFRYQYDFNNDGIFDTAITTQSSVLVPAIFLNKGPSDVTVRGRIYDKDNGYTDYTRVIHVNNVPPSVNTLTDMTVGANTLLTQTGSFTDPGADTWTATVDYDWHAGDTDAVALPLVGKTFTLSHTYATPGSYTVAVTITEDNGASGTGYMHVTVLPTRFTVTALTPTSSGFDVQFNRAADTSVLNLYDGVIPHTTQYNTLGPADVTLVGQITGAVRGSLVWNPATNTASFVKTGGILAPDTYTVTLSSRSNGWKDLNGELLDGNNDGIAGGDYQTTFTVAFSSAPVLTLPDFARGPQQTLNVDAHGTGLGIGLPIHISDSSGVTSVDFDFVYDPTLLTIAGAALAQGMPMTGSWSVTNNATTPGDFRVSVYGSSALSAGARDLIILLGSIPASAPYGASEVLRLSNVRINENITGQGEQAIHKVVFFGDATGDAAIGAYDAFDVSRVAVGLDSGFYTAPLTDPVIIGDVTGDGTLSGQDASYLAQKSVHLPRPEIPDVPVPAPTVFASVDPTIAIPAEQTSRSPMIPPYSGYIMHPLRRI
ncbi:MAG: PKD domain-containing protein, partial [Thermoguttaceae bacterium]